MSIGKILRRRASGASWDQNDNPLLVIGLSVEILKLGLSPDDLRDVCRVFAKRLLSKRHTDLGESESEALKYSLAKERIEDPEQFEVALDEFRTTGLSGTKRLSDAEHRLAGERSKNEKLLLRIARAEQENKELLRAIAETRIFVFSSVFDVRPPDEDNLLGLDDLHIVKTLHPSRVCRMNVLSFHVLGGGQELRYKKVPAQPIDVEMSDFDFPGVSMTASRKSPTDVSKILFGCGPRITGRIFSSAKMGPKTSSPGLRKSYLKSMNVALRMFSNVSLFSFVAGLNSFEVCSGRIRETGEVIIGSVPYPYVMDERHRWRIVDGGSNGIRLDEDFAIQKMSPVVHQGDMLITTSPMRAVLAKPQRGADRPSHNAALAKRRPYYCAHVVLEVW